jgi:hypothetical protein
MLNQINELLSNKVGSMALALEKMQELEKSDPVAKKAGWKPARRGGRSFLITHQLQLNGQDELSFQPTWMSWAYHLLLSLIGLSVTAFFCSKFLSDQSIEMTLSVLIATMLSLWFIYTAIITLRPMAFDKKRSVFWKGWFRPANNGSKNVPIQSIHALQIISEQCSTSKSSQTGTRYRSYELNLVLDNGTRINLLDQKWLAQLQKDAIALASFLDVPLWDMGSL